MLLHTISLALPFAVKCCEPSTSACDVNKVQRGELLAVVEMGTNLHRAGRWLQQEQHVGGVRGRGTGGDIPYGHEAITCCMKFNCKV